VLKIMRVFVAKVVVNSGAVAEAVARAEGYPPDRIHVIFNGYGRQEKIELPVLAPSNALRLILVANLKPIKRIDDAIRILSRVRDDGGAAVLTIVGGDGPGRDGKSHLAELMRLSQDLGVAHLVTFAGNIADPMHLIAMSDVGLLSSESEGLSNSVIEYMFAGKPCLCTDVGGMKDLVSPGVTGELFAVGDIAAFSAAIQRFSNTREVMRKMGSSARQYAIQNFSAERMIDAHIELYGKILKSELARRTVGVAKSK
jgi:glycosyltransferase involved in cell wall biosynthesis